MASGDGQWPVCTQCKQERCGQNAADRESSSGTGTVTSHVCAYTCTVLINLYSTVYTFITN